MPPLAGAALAISGWFSRRALSLAEARVTPVHSDVEIEMAIIALGREPGGGLVAMPDGFTNAHRVPIISAAARNNVSAVYSASEFARDGGLLSYGVDLVDPFRRAASYASAQQGDRVRRIGWLAPLDENDPLAKSAISAFTKALADLGWADGRNVRIDRRSHGGDINRIRALARELVGLQPDIILTGGTAATAAVQGETRTIPIVFTSAADPVASGIVPRLNQPGGNITGFATYEASLGGKWLELLSEIAPGPKARHDHV